MSRSLPALFSAFVAAMSLGCGDLASLLSTSACVGHQEGPRMCAVGEDVGQLPGGNSAHCCESAKFKADAECVIIGSQSNSVSADVVTKLGGYFTGELDLEDSVKYSADLKILRYDIANHKLKEGHCNLHDTACEDNDRFIRRKWSFSGRVEVNAVVSGEARADLTRTARKDGVAVNSSVNASQKTTLLTVGPFSLCEENDHEACGNLEDTTPAEIPVIGKNGERSTVPFTPR